MNWFINFLIKLGILINKPPANSDMVPQDDAIDQDFKKPVGEWVLDEKVFGDGDLCGISKDGDVLVKVVERYGDYQIMGQSGCINIETGETKMLGAMVTETVKYVDKDGNIKLGHVMEEKQFKDEEV